MSDGDLVQLGENLARARVVCVGDVMLDRFVYGQVERVSPEAPIPVLSVAREETSLGGAGNVLRNLAALGAEASFVAVAGTDPAAGEIGTLLAAIGSVESHLLAERGRVTTVKTRYIGGNQQLLRADREQIAALGDTVRADLLSVFQEALKGRQATVISDYAKGALGGGVAAALIAAARDAGHIVLVDPKGTDYAIYRGATLIKPNRRELAHVTGRAVGSDIEVATAARRLIEQHGFGAVLVSLGEQGMLLVEAGGATHRLPTVAREVFDVSGAGDTVMAAMAAALAIGASPLEGARLANIAAGIVVGKIGTAAVHARELVDHLVDRDQAQARKIVPLAAALDHVARWRKNGLKIGFTNGVFDLLHPGHISLLQQARSACDRLIVGLNSDASTARLKGPGRPVNPESARSAVLASVAAADLVVVFEEDTPFNLIDAIRPDVLVKGADYKLSDVVGADIVQESGGKVILAELAPGHSTTATIGRMTPPPGGKRDAPS
ncbi:MAG TPA: D-glycero-beta-D-manno-heptose-7-phosphate kinase [Stellaceae bacterium]|nr:D-glycero-beta-D-manno-heptose-7-phosphate kinase [Stellaceae bacterium]